jgi:cyclase
MLKVRVMPCLLLKEGELVKTVKFQAPSYIGDPINAIKIYNEKEVDELILLDISATTGNKEISYDVLKEVTNECFMPLAYGGGIRTLEDAKKIFGLGIEKVIINSYAIENPGFVTKLAALYGNQSIVVSMDVKKNIWGNYHIYSHSGQKDTKIDPVTYAIKMSEMGAGEIFVNSIDRDGTWEGYDVTLVKKITSVVNIPVIACGGAGNVHHMAQVVHEGGASAVAAGSMVMYQKKGMGVLINFPERKELERLLN